MKLETLISLAVEEAKKSECTVKVGCIIFDKKRILSSGFNEMRNHKKLHPKFQRWRGSVHAEVNTILSAKTDLTNSSLLVIRINKKNELRLSLPCNECMKYIEYVGIKRVFYSISNYPYIQEIKL